MNQPAGFQIVENRRPSYFYGRRHDYIYYPIAWTDASTGASYEKGYYDENGQRYDNVAFEKDGKYENVLCHCPYCEQDTILNLDADKAASHSLQCPHCNAPMEIRSQLDEALADAESASADEEPVRAPRKKRRTWLIVLLILFALWAYGSYLERRESPSQGSGQTVSLTDFGGNSNTDLFGEVISLVRTEGNGYRISSDGAADRELVWDAGEDSYYDSVSDCWLWYNTDMDPAVWQYWYEGISSDFGDYGWMEHDETGWYIEESHGNWIELPDKYDASALWYIED